RLWPGDGAPSLFPVPAERGQGLPQPQPGKWHRPPAVTLKRHQKRQSGRLRNNEHLSNLSLLSQPGQSMHEDLVLG
ncbi:MAG: hypothetical protein JSU72_11840, partial [Deltaproteobacteria bacterium]